MQTAADIASQVRSGRLAAVDVVTEALSAADQSHADLNAFTLIDPIGAMHRAEGIDRIIAAGKDPGPLAGVPIGLKDLIDDAGMPTTSGASFPTEIASHSAPVVRRLGAAGGVIIGRTGLHEFAFGFTSENPWFGPVRNPWDTTTSPGGSSGGSGAVVAAGVVPLAIGTDTGGSVRVPAAMCGVMGLKVTHGRVPTTGVQPLVPSLDTVGPIASTVEDLRIAFEVMAGDDPTDPWSQPVPVTHEERLDLGNLTLGVVRQWQVAPIDPDVHHSLERFISTCEAIGITVLEIDDASLAPPDTLVHAIGPEIAAVHGDRFSAHPERYGPDVAERIEAALSAPAEHLVDAERWGSQARATVQRLHDAGVHALVSPTVGSTEKQIGIDTITIDGVEHHHRKVLAPFTAPINRMRVPALSIPVNTGTGKGGSVQLVGPMWSEAALLNVAGMLEDADVISVNHPPIFFD